MTNCIINIILNEEKINREMILNMRKTRMNLNSFLRLI